MFFSSICFVSEVWRNLPWGSPLPGSNPGRSSLQTLDFRLLQFAVGFPLREQAFARKGTQIHATGQGCHTPDRNPARFW